jgi:hypothetical protein
MLTCDWFYLFSRSEFSKCKNVFSIYNTFNLTTRTRNIFLMWNGVIRILDSWEKYRQSVSLKMDFHSELILINKDISNKCLIFYKQSP